MCQKGYFTVGKVEFFMVQYLWYPPNTIGARVLPNMHPLIAFLL